MSAASETIELPVRGMTCGHCVRTVRTALEGVPGVRSAEVVLDPGSAKVVFDADATEPSRLKNAIEGAGYSVGDDSKPAVVTIGGSAQPKAAVVTIGGGVPPKPSSEVVREDWNLKVRGMHCASCVSRVEEALRAVPGVRSAKVNLATERAVVAVDPSRVLETALSKAAKGAGYSVERAELSLGEGSESLRKERAEAIAYWRNRLILGALLTVPMIVIGYAPFSLRWRTPVGWIMLPLATILLFELGLPYMIGAWKRLRQWTSNMDTLIALGVLTAYGYSLFHLLDHNPFRRAYLLPFFAATAYGIVAWAFVKVLLGRGRRAI